AAQVGLVVGHAGAEAAHGEAGPHDHRVAEVVGGGEQLVHGVADPRAGGFAADPFDDLLELLAVLRLVDGVQARADHLDAELLEGAVLGEGDGGVERGLPAQGGQQRIGPLRGDDRADDLRVDRLDVGGVGDLRIGHDRGRVGVDEDDPQALLAQHPAGLGPGVVELRGLADHDRAGADDQDGGEVGATGHQDSLDAEAARWAIASSARRSKRGEASCGPPAAAGWYWSEDSGRSRKRRPSTTSSLSTTCETSTRPERPPAWGATCSPSSGTSTAKPWLWAVIATCPVSRSCTGWLMPRWPNFSLYVSKPRARPSSWLPKQIPKKGTPASSTPRSSSTCSVAAAGSPGPLEKNTASGERASRSSREVGAGSRSTRRPREGLRRGAAPWTPGSTAATSARPSPSGSRTTGWAMVTSSTKLAPVISGCSRTCASSCSWEAESASPEKIPPRREPVSRSLRVSMRVSMSLMPTTSLPTSSSSRVCSAR